MKNIEYIIGKEVFKKKHLLTTYILNQPIEVSYYGEEKHDILLFTF